MEFHQIIEENWKKIRVEISYSKKNTLLQLITLLLLLWENMHNRIKRKLGINFLSI